MILPCFVVGTLLLLVSSVCGAPLKLETLKVGSKIYRDVTVVGANATDLYFTNGAGIKNVKLKQVDAALQKRFNYDPRTAKEAERQQAEDDSLYHAAIASNILASFEKTARAARKAAISSEDNLADPISEKSLLGKPGPALQVEKWLSQKPALDKRFVLITFLEPWSIPCRKMIPELNALQKKFGDNLALVAVSSESEEDMRAMPEPKIEFASAIDSKGALSSAAGVTSVPYALLLDPKGVVCYQGHPAAINESKLQSLLAKIAQ